MKKRHMWMVRAESGGKLFEDFKNKSIVAIGWREMGDVSAFIDRESFARAVAKAYPEMKKMQAAISSGQVYRFVREMTVGDRVLTYDPSARVYLVGTIASEHFYDPDLIEDYPNCRRVAWDSEVARDRLSVATKNSLGAISTLFLLPLKAAAEMEGMLAQRSSASTSVEPEDEEAEVGSLLKDIQSKALEFTKDKVSKLDWDEMQQLVAGLLRAMGYKTRVSPSGPDRGRDIVASPDGFGFESPRIVVEVKHRTGSPMGAQEVRSFLGGRHRDDKGLYVSTGGFTKDARYEAERATIPLTLMDLGDLVKALLEQYEKMDIETQRLIPLRKVYWPA